MSIELKKALEMAAAEEPQSAKSHKGKGFTVRLTHSAVLLPLTMSSLAFMTNSNARRNRKEEPASPGYTQWLHATVKAEPSRRDETGSVTRVVRVSGILQHHSGYTIDNFLAHQISSRCELRLDGDSWIPVSVELTVVYFDGSEHHDREVQTSMYNVSPADQDHIYTLALVETSKRSKA